MDKEELTLIKLVEAKKLNILKLLNKEILQEIKESQEGERERILEIIEEIDWGYMAESLNIKEELIKKIKSSFN